jgi:hypothetical protein
VFFFNICSALSIADNNTKLANFLLEAMAATLDGRLPYTPRKVRWW